jgi:GTP-binding protein
MGVETGAGTDTAPIGGKADLAPIGASAPRALAVLNQAKFVRSVVDAAGLPEDSRAEVCFAGRSNAGKSSAINVIVNQKRLAFVSKQPGRTRELNFFALNEARYLVDLPGYGYASAARDLRQSWDKLIGNYLLQRTQLAAVVLIMDIRHAPTELDLQFLDFLRPARRDVHVLLTKADKLVRSARTQALRTITQALSEQPLASMQLFSSLSGEGVEQARLVICAALAIELPAAEPPRKASARRENPYSGRDKATRGNQPAGRRK